MTDINPESPALTYTMGYSDEFQKLLARRNAAAPGELHGIDMEASQIEMARSVAAAGGHDNAFFRTGDATDLPFEDASFDVAHCHAVLMHVPDTQAVLTEVKRVLKPGGSFLPGR